MSRMRLLYYCCRALALVIVLTSGSALASFPGCLGECFDGVAGLCNCCNHGTLSRVWATHVPGENVLSEAVNDSTKAGKNCPPYLKGKGHDGCLKQFHYPDYFEMFYQKYCAEADPSTSYFKPKIHVRIKNCNIFCWTQSASLGWNGECAVFPGPYLFPIIRICARVAVPYDQVHDLPADPGYTKGTHLNQEGATVVDEAFEGSDGKLVHIDSPKVCAYYDPGLLDSILLGDIFDINPIQQALHHTQGMNPIVQILIDVVKMGGNLVQMITMLLGNIPVIGDIVKFLGFIVEWFSKVIVVILEAIGQINKVVLEDLGCASIPLGPFPPNYFDKLQPPKPSPTVHPICKTLNKTGNPLQLSSTSTPCAYSTAINSIINNSIRVSFDNYLPICTASDIAAKNLDGCVQILNASGAAPKVLFMASLNTPNMGMLPVCSASTTIPCVSNPTLSQNIALYPQGVRLVFAGGMGVKNQQTMSDFYNFDFVDCDNDSSSYCQTIWGVNTGQFQDITLTYPQQSNNELFLAQELTIPMKGFPNQTSHFLALIASQYAPYPSNSAPTIAGQDPKKICVYKNISIDNTPSWEVIGCDGRLDPPKPSTAPSAQSTILSPSIVARLTVGDSYTEGVVNIPAYQPNANTNSTEDVTGETGLQVFLAGYAYSAYATDANNSKLPFSGERSTHGTSLYGSYKDNAIPYSSSGKVNQSAVYLNGLEYEAGQYVAGGTKICLSGYQVAPCMPSKNKDAQPGSSSCYLTMVTDSSNNNILQPQCDTNTGDNCVGGNANCVLAKYANNSINSNNIDCDIFASYSQKNPGFSLCVAGDTSCTPSTEAPPVAGIVINNCANSRKCYTYTQNGAVGTNALCAITYNSANRIFPPPSVGDTIPDDQCYNIGAANTSNNSDSIAYVKAYNDAIKAAMTKYPAKQDKVYTLRVCAEDDEAASGRCVPDNAAPGPFSVTDSNNNTVLVVKDCGYKCYSLDKAYAAQVTDLNAYNTAREQAINDAQEKYAVLSDSKPLVACPPDATTLDSSSNNNTLIECAAKDEATKGRCTPDKSLPGPFSVTDSSNNAILVVKDCGYKCYSLDSTFTERSSATELSAADIKKLQDQAIQSAQDKYAGSLPTTSASTSSSSTTQAATAPTSVSTSAVSVPCPTNTGTASSSDYSTQLNQAIEAAKAKYPKLDTTTTVTECADGGNCNVIDNTIPLIIIKSCISGNAVNICYDITSKYNATEQQIMRSSPQCTTSQQSSCTLADTQSSNAVFIKNCPAPPTSAPAATSTSDSDGTASSTTTQPSTPLAPTTCYSTNLVDIQNFTLRQVVAANPGILACNTAQINSCGMISQTGPILINSCANGIKCYNFDQDYDPDQDNEALQQSITSAQKYAATVPGTELQVCGADSDTQCTVLDSSISPLLVVKNCGNGAYKCYSPINVPASQKSGATTPNITETCSAPQASTAATISCTTIDTIVSPSNDNVKVAVKNCNNTYKCYQALTDDIVDQSSYNKANSLIRDKTEVEHGSCQPIPQPTCPEITQASAATGYATWSAAQFGNKSIGTCASGEPVSRYCLLDKRTGIATLEPLTAASTCVPLGLNITNIVDDNYGHSLPPANGATPLKGTLNFGLANKNQWLPSSNTFPSKVTITIHFNIANLAKLTSFVINNTYYADTDGTTVTLNGNNINLPYAPITPRPTRPVGNVNDAVFDLSSPLDLKSYIIEGDNMLTITTDVRTNGGVQGNSTYGMNINYVFTP